MEVVREALEEDPEALKGYVQDRIRRNLDIPRGLMLALEALYAAEEAVRVEESTDLSKVDLMSDAELDQLWRQLEGERRTEPFSVDAYRAWLDELVLERLKEDPARWRAELDKLHSRIYRLEFGRLLTFRRHELKMAPFVRPWSSTGSRHRPRLRARATGWAKRTAPP